MNELIYTPNETYRATLTTADLQLVLNNDYYDALWDSNTCWSISFTEFGGLTATIGVEEQLLWPEFIQYVVGLGHKPTSTKWGRLIGGYWLREGSPRSNGAVEIVHMAILDVDAKPGMQVPSLEEMRARFRPGAQGIYGCKVLAYTTHSHSPENPRYRMIFPLARGVAPNEYAALWGGMNEALGGILDLSTKDISRIQYLPICPPEKLDIAEWFEANYAAEMLNPEPLIIAGQKAGPQRSTLSRAVGGRSQCTLNILSPETPRAIARLDEMLRYISADCNYETYRSVVWGILSTGWQCAEQKALDWSVTAPHRFEPGTLNALIDSYNYSKSPTLGTIHHLACAGGWVE